MSTLQRLLLQNALVKKEPGLAVEVKTEVPNIEVAAKGSAATAGEVPNAATTKQDASKNATKKRKASGAELDTERAIAKAAAKQRAVDKKNSKKNVKEKKHQRFPEGARGCFESE